jgi:hypothetical protein
MLIGRLCITLQVSLFPAAPSAMHQHFLLPILLSRIAICQYLAPIYFNAMRIQKFSFLFSPISCKWQTDVLEMEAQPVFPC